MTPAVETVFTMAPPCSSMPGSTARHMRKVPVRLTAMILSQPLRDWSGVWANPPMPAMLHRLVIGPSSSSARATTPATAFSSVTSQRSAMARPPAPAASSLISAATVSMASAATSRQATAPPSAARRRAVARPMPEPAPVTSATRPA